MLPTIGRENHKWVMLRSMSSGGLRSSSGSVVGRTLGSAVAIGELLCNGSSAVVVAVGVAVIRRWVAVGVRVGMAVGVSVGEGVAVGGGVAVDEAVALMVTSIATVLAGPAAVALTAIGL